MTTPAGPPDLPPGGAAPWPGSGPPPPTWGAGEPSATSESAASAAMGTAAASPTAPAPTPSPAPSSPGGRPNYGRRRALVVAGAIAIVVVIALVVWLAVRGGDSNHPTVAATTTTASARNAVPPAGTVSALHFQPFQSSDPVFTIFTPGAARRDTTVRTIRFGPAAGATGRWTLDVLPASAGADLGAVVKSVAARGGATVAPMADTGTIGTHLDQAVTGPGGVVRLVHVAAGASNLFVLTVPLRSGGTVLTGRAIFNQMAGSLRAPGVG